MFDIGSRVQIINHSEPVCNGEYGTITAKQIAYDGYTYYYVVELDDSLTTCTCIDDELMEAWPMVVYSGWLYLVAFILTLILARMSRDMNR